MLHKSAEWNKNMQVIQQNLRLFEAFFNLNQILLLRFGEEYLVIINS